MYVHVYRENHAHLFEFKPEELCGMESAADADAVRALGAQHPLSDDQPPRQRIEPAVNRSDCNG
jgi:hypothetical protein